MMPNIQIKYNIIILNHLILTIPCLPRAIHAYGYGLPMDNVSHILSSLGMVILYIHASMHVFLIFLKNIYIVFIVLNFLHF